jgi:hypothetical protein
MSEEQAKTRDNKFPRIGHVPWKGSHKHNMNLNKIDKREKQGK